MPPKLPVVQTTTIEQQSGDSGLIIGIVTVVIILVFGIAFVLSKKKKGNDPNSKKESKKRSKGSSKSNSSSPKSSKSKKSKSPSSKKSKSKSSRSSKRKSSSSKSPSSKNNNKSGPVSGYPGEVKVELPNSANKSSSSSSVSKSISDTSVHVGLKVITPPINTESGQPIRPIATPKPKIESTAKLPPTILQETPSFAKASPDRDSWKPPQPKDSSSKAISFVDNTSSQTEANLLLKEKTNTHYIDPRTLPNFRPEPFIFGDSKYIGLNKFTSNSVKNESSADPICQSATEIKTIPTSYTVNNINVIVNKSCDGNNEEKISDFIETAVTTLPDPNFNLNELPGLTFNKNEQ
uniref:Uncharacterized protein n=1 Tax=Rhabditophanes sp. KR3021 TaxID=114890 RepID=A0AC35UI88_9BILA